MGSKIHSLDNENLSQLDSSIGKLINVDYLFDMDLPYNPTGINLIFEHKIITIEAIPDDDSIRIVLDQSLNKSLYKSHPVSEAELWRKAINKSVRWTWLLENQQGYTDALQLELFHESFDETVIIQLLVVASCIQVYEVKEFCLNLESIACSK